MKTSASASASLPPASLQGRRWITCSVKPVLVGSREYPADRNKEAQ
jgi:hypothetical protein